MKKLLFAIAVLAATTATASAQGPPPGYDPNCGGGAPGQVGYGHPGIGLPKPGIGGGFFSKLFSNHKGGFGKGRYHDRVNNATMLPAANSGTLVFPQNPFIRSPRDYFMAGK